MGRRAHALLLLLPLALSGCAWLARASVSSSGTEGDLSSHYPAVSDDGRWVAFASFASTLVDADSNGYGDVFLRDSASGTTERISVNSAEAQALGGSSAGRPSVSDDGRYVAFQSDATNLVGSDTNAASDVFVRDRVAGTTERVSVKTGGVQGNGSSLRPWISADGRYVAFTSWASNLVAGDSNATWDVFVRDRQAGTTVRASVSDTEAQANGASDHASISDDGRLVAFDSGASNLVLGDGNGVSDVFVRDLFAGTTEIVSVTSNEAAANAASDRPAVSGAGWRVAFQSNATNLGSNDGNAVTDVFVRDRSAGTTVRASVASDETEGSAISISPVLSDDGRYVAFDSYADELAPDADTTMDVFVRDLAAGTTELVTLGGDGTPIEAYAAGASISGDGRYVAFETAASVVGDDTNGEADVFVRARPVPNPTLVAPAAVARGTTASLLVTGSEFRESFVAFTSGTGIKITDVTFWLEGLVEVDVNVSSSAPTGWRDLFVVNLGTGPGTYTGALGACLACLQIT